MLINRPTLFSLIVLFELTLPNAGWGQGVPLQIKQDGLALALAWSGDGKLLASGGEGGAIVVTEIPEGKEFARLPTGAAVAGLVFSPDGKVLGVKAGVQDGPLSVWDLAMKKKLRQLAFKGYSCPHLAFSQDGQTLIASGPGEKMVWNHVKGSGYGSRTGKVPEGSSAAVSPDGAIVAWCNPQGLVQMYLPEQRKTQTMNIKGAARALAFSADARLLAAAAEDKTIGLWAVQGGELRKFEGLREPAGMLHFSANGKVLAAASPEDPVVRLWDVANARLRRRLTTPGGIRALALSPDGNSLALADGVHVRVWNVATRDLGDLGQPRPLTLDEQKSAWEDLASSGAAKAEEAFRLLARSQQHSLDFLKEQVRTIAVPPLDHKRVQQLLSDLDDSMYPRRQRASVELAKLGEIIQPALEKYLASKPSVEGLMRAKKLLEEAQDPVLTPNRLRCLEAIEILEILKTPQSRSVLEEIARDALLNQIRQAARDSLQRLRTVDKD